MEPTQDLDVLVGQLIDAIGGKNIVGALTVGVIIVGIIVTKVLKKRSETPKE